MKLHILSKLNELISCQINSCKRSRIRKQRLLTRNNNGCNNRWFPTSSYTLPRIWCQWSRILNLYLTKQAKEALAMITILIKVLGTILNHLVWGILYHTGQEPVSFSNKKWSEILDCSKNPIQDRYGTIPYWCILSGSIRFGSDSG